MPYTYEFVESAGCVVVTWSGRISVDESLRFMKEFAGLPAFRSGLHRIHDLRGADTNLSSEELRIIADRVGQFDELQGERRTALLVGDDLSYGLSRIFMAVSSTLLAKIQVTKNAGEAKEWVGLASDYVLPADR